MRSVRVDLGERSYDVVVGRGVREQLGALVPASARRAAIITQPGIPFAVDPGIEHRVFMIADGEQSKQLSTIEHLCRELARFGLTRNDVVIGVGGGVVTDVAGFTAASYHRGVAVVHVATSLLAMIDAAIGGKTGVNIPEGKNLVGAYWQPSGVVCDLDALDTLPPRELACGLGEMAKYHFLGGDDLLGLPLEAQVARCVEIKADVVGSDERESGRRAILNYGHTLAHALETFAQYDLRHGEAVAIGLMYAAYVAEALERIGPARVGDHVRVLESYGLTYAPPAGVGAADVLPLFSRDKKALDGVTFVLDGPRGVESVTGVSDQLLVHAYNRLELLR